MSRYIFLLFCMAVNLTILSACDSSQSTAEWEPTIYETVNNLDGVTMIVKNGTVSSHGLTIKFENPFDKQFSFGRDFLLEKKLDGKWYQVPDILGGRFAFTDDVLGAVPSEVDEWTFDTSWIYGELKIGEYRFVKEVSEFRDTGNFESFILTADLLIL